MLDRMPGKMRLDRLLSNSTVLTRKDAKDAVRRGRVTVGGTTVKDPSVYVSPEDEIALDGERICYRQYVYLMMNKPKGVLTATEDRKGDATFADLIGDDYSFYGLGAAGRLDKDAEGMLLLTNDGAFVHGIITPERHIYKEYICHIEGKVPEDAEKSFEDGIIIDGDYKCRPASIEILKEGTGPLDLSEVKVRVCEGRFHQVKKMISAIGCKVIYLKRISIGGVELSPELSPGQYRELTDKELETLKGVLK